MKNEQTAVIKDMEFLLNELHKEWERPGEVKSSVSIPYEKVEEISRKLNVIVYETQQSADSDGLAFKQSIAKSIIGVPDEGAIQFSKNMSADISFSGFRHLVNCPYTYEPSRRLKK